MGKTSTVPEFVWSLLLRYWKPRNNFLFAGQVVVLSQLLFPSGRALSSLAQYAYSKSSGSCCKMRKAKYYMIIGFIIGLFSLACMVAAEMLDSVFLWRIFLGLNWLGVLAVRLFGLNDFHFAFFALLLILVVAPFNWLINGLIACPLINVLLRVFSRRQ